MTEKEYEKRTGDSSENEREKNERKNVKYMTFTDYVAKSFILSMMDDLLFCVCVFLDNYHHPYESVERT